MHQNTSLLSQVDKDQYKRQSQWNSKHKEFSGTEKRTSGVDDMTEKFYDYLKRK
jgi:hypothetical protein